MRRVAVTSCGNRLGGEEFREMSKCFRFRPLFEIIIEIREFLYN